MAGAFGVAAALALTGSAQANLLVDPGYENGAAEQPNPIPVPGGANGGWAVFNGATYANAAAETGSWGLECTEAPGQAWNYEASYQLTSVTPDDMYSMTVDFKSPTGITEGAGGYVPVLLQLTYFDSTGTQIGNANVSQYTPTSSWQTGGVLDTLAPSGAAYVGSYIGFMEDGSQTGTDVCYFDNVSLVQVPEPATIALLGMGLAFPLYLIRRRK